MNEELMFYELARNYSGYPVEAYQFVKEALAYAADSRELNADSGSGQDVFNSNGDVIERHFTGQELCEAIRVYAINQFGYLAKVVLKAWNVDCTDCFGDLVYNMIDFGMLNKSEQDRREDFHEVYRFEDVFQTGLEINRSIAVF